MTWISISVYVLYFILQSVENRYLYIIIINKNMHGNVCVWSIIIWIYEYIEDM